MLHLLKRHPLPVEALFRHCLVLTYAFPIYILSPLLPPGLALDSYGEFGFLAVALVQTEGMRPSFFPRAFGYDFFLRGYRIFTRRNTPGGALRGLFILRSDTDKRLMVGAGNLLTHYRYRLCQTAFSENLKEMKWSVRTPNAEADLDVRMRVEAGAAPLPAGSPFATDKDARRFAGPLPNTFDYEPETHSMIRIRGVRKEWNPKPVAVAIDTNTFFQQEPFQQVTPLLASAFYLHDVAYRWERGIRTPLEAQ
jgi:hypothetical protein